MLVLPFVKPGTWIAHHDIALKDIPRFAHETGPFHVYEVFGKPKKKSQLERQNIGAFQIDGDNRDYEEILLASMAQEWTVSGVTKESFHNRIYELTERYYSVAFAKEVRQLIEAHNVKVKQRKERLKAEQNR